MRHALIPTVLLLALTWLHQPIGAGFAWDALNAIGFVALAALLALHLHDFEGAHDRKRQGDVRAEHAWIAYAALAFVFVHAAALIVYDPVLLEYFRPTGPFYFWAGVIALVLLGFVVFSASTPRRRARFGPWPWFRRAHRVMAAVVVALAVWHVAGSGFYLADPITVVSIVLVVATTLLAPRPLAAGLRRITPEVSSWTALTATLALAALHAGARSLT
jgi:hypothetical protein